jgi:hypothetical protein
LVFLGFPRDAPSFLFLPLSAMASTGCGESVVGGVSALLHSISPSAAVYTDVFNDVVWRGAASAYFATRPLFCVRKGAR